MRQTINVWISDELLQDKQFDYRMYLWLLLQADDNNQLEILSFNKTNLKTESGISHSATINRLLDYILYIPQYDLFEQIKGNLKKVNVVNPKDRYDDAFTMFLDKNIVKILLSDQEENSDKRIKVFLYFWKRAGSFKYQDFKPGIKETLEAIGLTATQKNRDSLYKCVNWMQDNGFIQYTEDSYMNCNKKPVPCFNVKWTWSNADGFDNKVIEEKIEEIESIEEKLPPIVVEEKPVVEEKTIEVEDWQKELAERMLGRSASTEEYEKMLAKKGTLVTKEQWERNGGMTGQRTQEEYEAVILDRIKQVLKIT